jgi:hypothetical protein
MRSITLSIGHLLTHSLITLITIAVMAVVFLAILYWGSDSASSIEKINQLSIIMALVTSSFLGVYLGGGFAVLKQHYLWELNLRYKSTLFISTIIIAFISSLIFVPYFWAIIEEQWLFLFVPFGITLFSMHMILGKTFIHKLSIPAVPFLIYKLDSLDISMTAQLTIFVITVFLLATYMLKSKVNNKAITKEQGKDEVMGLFEMNALRIKLNTWAGTALERYILTSKKQFSWALSMPITRLGLISLEYAVLLFIMSNMLEIGEQAAIEMLALMFITLSPLTVIMESRNLLGQLKPITHLYLGVNHRELKKSIIYSVDKLVIFNTLILLTSLYVIIALMKIDIDLILLGLLAVSILLLVISIVPLLLSLYWNKVNISLVISVSSYFGLIVVISKYLKTHSIENLSFITIGFFLVGCLLLRIVTSRIFYSRSIELLLKK